MGMVAEDDQSFEGLVEHLHDAFQLGETLSKLISNFHSCAQMTRETEDIFADDLQVLARKIIVCKSSFCLEANHQLKDLICAQAVGSLLCCHGPQHIVNHPQKKKHVLGSMGAS